MPLLGIVSIAMTSTISPVFGEWTRSLTLSKALRSALHMVALALIDRGAPRVLVVIGVVKSLDVMAILALPATWVSITFDCKNCVSPAALLY